MAKVQVILSVIAFAICQVSGQLSGDYQYGQITYTTPLPAAIDPLGCSRGTSSRSCTTFFRGAALPIAIDRMGCTRPGGVSLLEDPLRLCSTYIDGAKYPVAIDRYGVTGNGATITHPVPAGRPSGGSTGGRPSGGAVFVPTGASTGVPTGGQTGAVFVPTGTNAGRPTGATAGGTQYRPYTPVVGGTNIYGRYPSTPNNYVPIPSTSYTEAETLPQIQDVQTVVVTAKAAQEAVVPTTLTAAATAGQGISASFEQVKQQSQTALTTVNPANAQDIMGRITATIDNGRHSVNNALSNAQYNPEGALNDAKQAASITLAEVERTLKENNVPDDVASSIIENARAQVNGAVDTGVASVAAVNAANVAAKETVKTTTVAKIEEITVAADSQIADYLGNVNTQIKTVVPDLAKQKEIDDMLNRARNDIAANLATAKNNPSAAIQPSRVTAHSTLNEIARMLRNENVPEDVINQIIEPNRTQIINVLNEAEYKINTSVYQASTVGVRV